MKPKSEIELILLIDFFIKKLKQNQKLGLTGSWIPYIYTAEIIKVSHGSGFSLTRTILSRT